MRKLAPCVFLVLTSHAIFISSNKRKDSFMDLVTSFIDYESGMMSGEDTIKFFQYLLDSGMLDNLGSNYQAIAHALIRQGFCFE